MKLYYYDSLSNYGECIVTEKIDYFAPYCKTSKFFINKMGLDLYIEELKTKTKFMETNYWNNAVKRIELYKRGSTWLFDDEYLNIVGEPFVCGASEAIQYIVDSLQIKDKEHLVIIFGEKLGDWDAEITLTKDGGDNAWYELKMGDVLMRLWLCPCLCRFFSNPPKTIFIKFY